METELESPRRKGPTPPAEPVPEISGGAFTTEAPVDDADPYKFKLSDFEISPDEVGVTEPDVGVIAVGRPHPQVFFRARSDFRVLVKMIELKDGGEGTFLLSSSLVKSYEEEAKTKELRLLQTRFGSHLIYPAGLPDQDGRLNTWTASARMAVQAAEERWVRMVSDRPAGQYHVRPAKDQTARPDVRWPELSVQELLEKAFGHGNLITRHDHPVLLRLQGLRGA